MELRETKKTWRWEVGGENDRLQPIRWCSQLSGQHAFIPNDVKGEKLGKGGFFQGGKARAISDVCVCVREYVYVCVYSSHEESAPF